MSDEKNEPNIIIKLLKIVLNICCWIASIFIFLLAMIQFMINYVVTGIIFVLGALIINPKFITIINKRTNNKLNVKNRILILILLFIAFIMALISIGDDVNGDIGSEENENIIAENIVETENSINIAEVEEIHNCNMEVFSTTNATCKNEGKIVYKCSEKNCDKTEEDILEMIGHSYEKGICTMCSEKDPNYVEEPVLSDKEIFIQSCENYKYKEIARNPHEFVNKNVKFTGKVIQVSENINWFSDETSVTILLAVTKDEYGFYDDTIYCTYTYSKNESKILEDDIITIYGVCNGDYSYMSVLGANITVPKVTIKYYDINE